MKLLVLGGNGRTGRLVVERALAAGHTVTAFSRDPSKVKLSDERLSIVNGDARYISDLNAALKGQDAVINTIGGGERKLIEKTTTSLLTAMRESGVKRVVYMSTFIATPNFKPSGTMRLFPRLVRGMAQDDLAGVRLVEGSDLEWTIVYATILKNKPGADFRPVGPDEILTAKNFVNRAAVAECLLEAVTDRATIGQALLITGAGERIAAEPGS
ncbi:MAG: NAD(P)-binding oxidoreductase [Gaiellaceae bacterium]